MTFKTVCPLCGDELDEQNYCAQDDTTYPCVNGIWRFLPPERGAYFAPFITDYEAIRTGEGRGSQQSAWYRALPYAQPDTPFADDWRIRAKSYETLCKRVLTSSGLSIVDVGAGNSWLSHRLAAAGHHVAAVDLLVNDADGLGAKCHYPVEFASYQAEFDHLPFAAAQFDYVIFNGVFHYSEDYDRTLTEARRILKPGGGIVIMDTPVYHDASSGQQMLKERETYFKQHYGTPSNHLQSEGYLTYDRLKKLNWQWQRWTPFYGLRWHLKPLRARLRGHREPAKFHVLVGRMN